MTVSLRDISQQGDAMDDEDDDDDLPTSAEEDSESFLEEDSDQNENGSDDGSFLDEDDAVLVAQIAGRSTLFQAFLAQMPHDDPPPTTGPGHDEMRNPREEWDDFVRKITESNTPVFKIADSCVRTYGLEEGDINPWNESMADELIEAVESARSLTHVILGSKILALLAREDQVQRLLSTVLREHHDTLSYLKLGSEDESLYNVMPTTWFCDAFAALDVPFNLTEVEVWGLEFAKQMDVIHFATIAQRFHETLRQLNIFSLIVHSELTLDPIFLSLHTAPVLDELRITVKDSSRRAGTALISPETLETLLQEKKKWWRLGFDGMGLSDAHCHVLARMFSRDETCKVGDLLSMLSCPAIGKEGYEEIFSVFFFKQRMGLIKVDDKAWEAKFDLVRSMNNLHGRLDYVDNGAFRSRHKWVEWLAKLGNLSWEDENHKLNYIWFTLVENPRFIAESATL